MNLTIKIAITGALLAGMAVPAYAAKEMTNEKSGAKAEHGKQHHGREFGKLGRHHNAMMSGHGIIMTFYWICNET